MCHRVKVGSSVIKGVYHIRNPKIGERWDQSPWGGAWMTPMADLPDVKHHAYADDTQLYLRCRAQEAS